MDVEIKFGGVWCLQDSCLVPDVCVARVVLNKYRSAEDVFWRNNWEINLLCLGHTGFHGWLGSVPGSYGSG